jgi:hypothetical protein
VTQVIGADWFYGSTSLRDECIRVLTAPMEIVIKLSLWILVLLAWAGLFLLYEKIFHREPSQTRQPPAWALTFTFWAFAIVSAAWIFSR